MKLYLTDYTTTVALSDGANQFYTRKGGRGYVPVAPEIDEREIERAGRDGALLSSAALRNVRERFEVWLHDPTSTLDAKQLREQRHRAVMRLFEQARAGVEPVYAQYQPETSENVYRSRVLSGRLIPSQTVHDPGNYEADILLEDIEWTHAPWWEDENPVTVGSATGVTNTATPIQIAGAGINGDLAAPAIIAFQNTYSDRVQRVAVSANRYAAPTLFAPGFAGYSASVPAAIPPAMLMTLVGTTALSSAFVTRANNVDFRAVARVSQKPSDAWYMWSLNLLGRAVWQSTLFQVPTRELVVMGEETVPIPPWPTGGATQHALELELWALSVAGGTVTVDDLYLLPTDGWRHWVPSAYGADPNVTITDDPLSNRMSTSGWSGGGAAGNYIAYGREIMLAPQRNHALYFLWGTGTVGLSASAATANVTVSIRPRRSTL